MNHWLDVALVSVAVVVSATYAIYALGPKRVKNIYSRFATKYFGLRAARWFVEKNDSCSGCSENEQHEKLRF